MDPNPYDLLERLSALLAAEQRTASTGLGLHRAQWSALAYLARCNRYSDTPTAVAEFLGTTKGTASQSLRRLEEKELIGAVDDVRDGRSIHYRLTSKGRRTVAKADPAARVEDALEGWCSADRQRFSGDLLRLLRGLQAAHKGRTFGLCRTCRFFTPTSDGARCGLTEESLSADDADRICREHEAP